jgi:hypothetical protein
MIFSSWCRMSDAKRQRTYVTVHGAISGDDIWPQLKRDRRDGGSAYRGQLARDRIGVNSRPMCAAACSPVLLPLPIPSDNPLHRAASHGTKPTIRSATCGPKSTSQ